MEEWTRWHERHKEKIELVAGIDCWIWTAGTTTKSRGAYYGRVKFDKGGGSYSEYAHRSSFFSFNGYMPGSDRHVCHRCGVGLCVRPSHLYDGTPQTNGLDKGVMRTGRGKLLDDDVLEIRQMYKDGVPLLEIADSFSIAFGTVYPIVMGRSYAHAPFPEGHATAIRMRSPLTDDELLGIRSRLRQGVSQRLIGIEFSVAQSIISRINTGKKHSSRCH